MNGEQVPQFDPEEYWGKREHKVWVVSLEEERRINGRKVTRRDKKYVRARTKEGAAKTALFHSPLCGRRIYVSVRLATPTDLGASRMVASGIGRAAE